jgi:hypothetical protein
VKALAVAAAALLCGCYAPKIQECTVRCGTDGSCPSGTRCGSDDFCHSGAASPVCAGGVDAPAADGRVTGPDGAPGAPDAAGHADGGPATADGPLADAGRLPDAPDAPPDAPDAPPDAPVAAPDAPDAPPDASVAPPDAPDAPPDAPVADANPCPASSDGEPDNSCPGKALGPLKEGTTLTVKDHVIYPTGDVDVFSVPIVLKPQPTCSSFTLSYAVRVQLTSSADVELARYGIDRACIGGTTPVGDSLCIPFEELCKAPPSDNPTFYFAVVGNGAAMCLPYTLTIQGCAAGSTCDHCILR